jgi:hypothetical protein
MDEEQQEKDMCKIDDIQLTNDTPLSQCDITELGNTKIQLIKNENNKMNISNIWETMIYYFTNIIYILTMYYKSFIQEYENRNNKKL